MAASPALPHKSTNVRKGVPPQEHTGRVVMLAMAFFGSLAAIGYAEGVFARLGDDLVLALSLFATGFAIATYALDTSVRDWVNRLARRAEPRKAPGKSPGGKPAAT